LPLGGFPLLPENILNDRKREVITILEFLDEADALHEPVIVFCNVSSALPGLWKESFPDIIMDGFLRDPGMFHQLSDFHGFSGRVSYFFIEYYYMLYIKVKRILRHEQLILTNIQLSL
jgi:hypothetical protein